MRPRGIVIDVRPSVAYQPALAIRGRRGRHVVGAIRRAPDPGLVGAQRGVEQVVREGWFDVVWRGRRRRVSRYRDLADLRRLISVNDNWTIDADVRRRLSAAWRDHAGQDPIEIARVFSLTILRKRARRR